MTFGEFLKQRRIELKLSQAQLAKRLSDLGQPTLSASVGHWEKERNFPPVKYPKFRQALASALELDINDLMNQMGYITIDGNRSSYARRAADIIDRLPNDMQETAISNLVEFETRYIRQRTSIIMGLVNSRLQIAERMLSAGESKSSELVNAALMIATALDLFLQELWQIQRSPTKLEVTDDLPDNLEVMQWLQSMCLAGNERVAEIKTLWDIRNRVVNMQISEIRQQDVEAMLAGVVAIITECSDT